MSISEIKSKAKHQINGKIAKLFLITIIYTIILLLSNIFSLVTFGVSSIIIVPCIIMGYYNIYLKLVETCEVEVSKLYSGFNIMGKSIGLVFLQNIYIFLWSLLFVIPGIIKSFSYSMSYYIMLENPEIGINEAIKKSSKIMEGNKLKLFLLQLSFIGWFLLAPFTFGLLYIYIIPYIQTSMVNFYNSIKN